MIYRDIGRKIQKAREEAGLSQEELASRLGYTQAALSNYELGKRRLYLANLEQIARQLNKPLSYFLDEFTTPSAAESEEDRDETIIEIIRLLSELPVEEREDILEYIKWRRDRQK